MKKPKLVFAFKMPSNNSEMPLGPSAQSGILVSSNADWRIEKPIVDKKKCKKCLICWVLCPEGVIDKEIDIDYNFCKGCGICARECPKIAISMVRESENY